LPVVLALVAASALLACSSTIKVDSDQFRLRVLVARFFETSTDRCSEATRIALADQGYEIRAETADSIVTQRRKYTVNAESTPIVPSTDGHHFPMEQSDQLWIEIRGEGGGCTVDVSKIRLWSGIEEMTEIEPMGADWARKNIVEALYREIDANL